MKKDELGDRMKEDYENRTQTMLPRRTHTLIRLDGKAFHTFTKGFARPYDIELMKMMDDTAIALCENIQGVSMAFVQSDEITLLLTDFSTIHTDAWFDGNVQKIVSISASIATAAFNKAYQTHLMKKNACTYDSYGLNMIKDAYFDSRVWTISDREEVINVFIWRQQDATRNSIQMAAQSMYSQKELHGKNTSELQEMMFQKGTNWNDYLVGFKRGRIILKEKEETITIPGRVNKFAPKKPEDLPEVETVTRMRWASFEPPVFTQDREFILSRIPVPGEAG